MSSGEFLVISIHSGSEPISVVAALERESGGGKWVRAFRIALNEPITLSTRFDFYSVLEAVYGNFRSHTSFQTLNAYDIPYDTTPVNKRDEFFADQFGYVIKNLATAKITDEGRIEAVIEPTLIHQKHPLASQTAGNQPYIESTRDDTPPYLGTYDHKSLLLDQYAIVSAHYARITVNDQPHVLAQLANEIAKENINICEVRQPESAQKVDPNDDLGWTLTAQGWQRKAKRESEMNRQTEVAFIFDPCPTESILSAFSSIARKVRGYKRGSRILYRVMGHPTRDISRK